MRFGLNGLGLGASEEGDGRVFLLGPTTIAIFFFGFLLLVFLLGSCFFTFDSVFDPYCNYLTTFAGTIFY